MQRLLTRWGKELDKNAPLNDYPRPQMARDSFINLNGVWEYAIYDENKKFSGYQGKIVVPFSPETILSGVEKSSLITIGARPAMGKSNFATNIMLNLLNLLFMKGRICVLGCNMNDDAPRTVEKYLYGQ